MTPAEQVTMGWLVSKGYFVMPSVKHGRNEMDLLGVKLADDKRAAAQKIHVEVQVSSAPLGSHLSEREYENEADKYAKKKFEDAKEWVQGVLGDKYERWLVVGKFGGGDREERVWNDRMAEKGVTVIRFDKVIREYVATLTTRPVGDEMGQILHILEAFGLLQSGLQE